MKRALKPMALAATMLSFFSDPGAAVGADTKWVDARICTPMLGTDNNKFNFNDGAIRVVDGLGNKLLACPIMRDNNLAQLLNVTLRGSNESTGAVTTCTLYGLDSTGFIVGSRSKTSNLATNFTLLWTGADVPSDPGPEGAYVLLCNMGPGVLVNGYGWTDG
jgi:hypothetical protein